MRCYICLTTFDRDEPCDCGECLTRLDYLEARDRGDVERVRAMDRGRDEWARTQQITAEAE